MSQDPTPISKPHLHTILHSMFIDFNTLASHYPQLYAHLVILGGRTTINFKRQDSLIVLTQAIMQCIFGLKFQCSVRNLCPRIPVRLNYLLWVWKFVPVRVEKMLDIGTGATLVYPLLAYSMLKWKSLAIDTNKDSVRQARKLVEMNKLEDWIRVIEVQDKEDVFDFQVQGENRIDVVICNPPFYDDAEEVEGEDGEKEERKPRGEMLRGQFACEGGQYSFFFNIYRASFKYVEGNRPNPRQIEAKYFTCLLGRQTTFIEVSKFLSDEFEHYKVLQIFKAGELRQGQNARYIVMWRPKVSPLQQ